MAHISVMIPTFNRAHFLPATIECALAQTFQDIDITIVDDASSDNTEATIQPYLIDPRVKYVKNMANLGLTRNWNLCLSLAKGPLINLLLSDDLIDATYFMEVSTQFARYPELGLVAASCRYIDASGTIIHPGHSKPPQHHAAGDEAVSFFLTEGFPNVSNIVFDKRCIDEVGVYDERIWHGPDVEFDVRVGSRFPVYHCGAVYSSFRRHGANSGNLEFLDKTFLETDLLKFSLAWQYLSKQGALALGIRDVKRHIAETTAGAALNGAAAAIAYGRLSLSLYYMRRALELTKRAIHKPRFWKNVLLIVGFPLTCRLMRSRLGIVPRDLVQASLFAAPVK
jgi:glycosyltransferase involved in cell wall biosynthesis